MYHDVEGAPDYVVVVKAVGIKVRNRVYVAGKEIQL